MAAEDGAVLRDPAWLAARTAEVARPWRSGDLRVTATLWWYAAAAVLLDQPVTMLVARGAASDPDPVRLRVRRRPSGYLDAARSEVTLPPGPARLGSALQPAFGETIRILAGFGGASPRSLWAIAGDALANRLLGLCGPGAAPDIAAQVAAGAGDLLPAPRFVQAGGRQFVRRGSCCLIYLLPGEGKCISCPRQHPQVRGRRLAEHAGASAG